MALRALQRRVNRIETARKPRPSPIVIFYGSFDKFVDATCAQIVAGTLSDEWYAILDSLRGWEDGGVWIAAYAR